MAHTVGGCQGFVNKQEAPLLCAFCGTHAAQISSAPSLASQVLWKSWSCWRTDSPNRKTNSADQTDSLNH